MVRCQGSGGHGGGFGRSQGHIHIDSHSHSDQTKRDFGSGLVQGQRMVNWGGEVDFSFGGGVVDGEVGKVEMRKCVNAYMRKWVNGIVLDQRRADGTMGG